MVQGVSEPRKVQADRQQLPGSTVGADQDGHRVFPGVMQPGSTGVHMCQISLTGKVMLA